jgi:hypothetical protein
MWLKCTDKLVNIETGATFFLYDQIGSRDPTEKMSAIIHKAPHERLHIDYDYESLDSFAALIFKGPREECEKVIEKLAQKVGAFRIDG